MLQHTSLQREGGGDTSRDESKFGNLTGTYHEVLVAFREFEIPEFRFLGSLPVGVFEERIKIF